MTCGGDWQPLPFGKFLPPVCIDCPKRHVGAELVGEVVDGVCESKLENAE